MEVLRGTKTHKNLTRAITERIRWLRAKGYSHLDAVIKAAKEYGVASEAQMKSHRLM